MLVRCGDGHRWVRRGESGRFFSLRAGSRLGLDGCAEEVLARLLSSLMHWGGRGARENVGRKYLPVFCSSSSLTVWRREWEEGGAGCGSRSIDGWIVRGGHLHHEEMEHWCASATSNVESLFKSRTAVHKERTRGFFFLFTTGVPH